MRKTHTKMWIWSIFLSRELESRSFFTQNFLREIIIFFKNKSSFSGSQRPFSGCITITETHFWPQKWLKLRVECQVIPKRRTMMLPRIQLKTHKARQSTETTSWFKDIQRKRSMWIPGLMSRAACISKGFDMLQALVDARLLRRQVASLSTKNSQPSSDDHGAGESEPNVLLLPGELTWNPKIEVWKMIFLFNWMIFRFHVIFQGVLLCNPFCKEVFPLFPMILGEKASTTPAFLLCLLILDFWSTYEQTPCRFEVERVLNTWVHAYSC